MIEVLKVLVLPLLVIVVTGVAGRLANRNEVAQTKAEVELLKELDPRSQAAQNLNEVIEDRVARWHSKRFKKTVVRFNTSPVSPPPVSKPSDRRLLRIGYWEWLMTGLAAVSVVSAFLALR